MFIITKINSEKILAICDNMNQAVREATVLKLKYNSPMRIKNDNEHPNTLTSRH